MANAVNQDASMVNVAFEMIILIAILISNASQVFARLLAIGDMEIFVNVLLVINLHLLLAFQLVNALLGLHVLIASAPN
ncbi:MAG: hypothetical protein HZC29_05985 [Thaumarchaeota archaeon]|nr:hypothetical protein [Nitrososphaerota archaeon]